MGSLSFTCDGTLISSDIDAAESLLDVLRDRLGIVSVKDGCAPQGQCGCCTVLVDGKARVACVTPASRVSGREVTTLAGLDEATRAGLVNAFVATGGSQCGFCTPGIVMRAAALVAAGRNDRVSIDRSLAAHLCRCTGWQTIVEAIEAAMAGGVVASRDLEAASVRAGLEGGTDQEVGAGVVCGDGGFADDGAPRGALVAVPAAAGSTETVSAVAHEWVVAPTIRAARARAGSVPGRRSTVVVSLPVPVPEPPDDAVPLQFGWVEPAYLEPDASWCLPGGEPASPLANGGAFGGKRSSVAPAAARALADRLDVPVRVVLSREDTVRLGPKRPPIGAWSRLTGSGIEIVGRLVGDPAWMTEHPLAYGLDVHSTWESWTVPGPATSCELRAVGVAEQTVLVEAALDAAAADRSALVADDRAAATLLDTCARVPGGATAGARATLDEGRVVRLEIRIAAGDPLDETVLRSYAIGAAQMALGWLTSESLTVDPETGDVLDLTIRSFGVLPARATPPIDVTIVDDAGPPRPVGSDAVFAAVAAAVANRLRTSEASGAMIS